MQWKKSTVSVFPLLCAAVMWLGSGKLLRRKRAKPAIQTTTRALERESAGTVYQWNVLDRERPLLGLSQTRLQTGFDQALVFPAEQLDFQIFKALSFDEEKGRYLVPAISRDTRTQTFVEFAHRDTTNSYVSSDGIELFDKGALKILKTADGTQYVFVRYPDDEFRCATIKKPTGETLSLLYTANGLALHGLSIRHDARLLSTMASQASSRSRKPGWKTREESQRRGSSVKRRRMTPRQSSRTSSTGAQ
jgi:hypothetical protein